ncbi:MAG: acetyltransferase [Sulfuricurvum sp. PC08-66]|nr:MAG: acetyltransferase [Sulfuricurvum sp. PC08-66]
MQSNVVFTKATLTDIPAMQALLWPYVEGGIILARSDDETATNIRSYILARQEGAIVGFLALHIHSPRLAEIRSLIVRDDLHGKGIGTQMIQEAIVEARKLGIQELLALTYAEHFFVRLGFEVIPKESLPDHKIWADCIKCRHFPVCNEISLTKKL